MKAARWFGVRFGWVPTALLVAVLLVLLTAVEARVLEAAWLDFFLAILQATGGAMLLLGAWVAERRELDGRPRRKDRSGSGRHPHVPAAPTSTPGRPTMRMAVLVASILLVAGGLYLVRPLSILHGPAWIVVKYPLVW